MDGTTYDDVAARAHDIRTILARYGMVDPRVFGSVARGDDRPDSDLDIVVRKTRAVGLITQARMRREIAEIVGRPVDVVGEDALHGHVRPNVLRDARPLP